jgi:WD40 repeat protein
MVAYEKFKCKICKELLDKPVKLPCNIYICQKHHDGFKEKQIICSVCYQPHIIPKKGCQVDSTMQDFINSLQMIFKNISKDERYNKLKELLNNYEDVFEDYKFVEENQTQEIDDYFSDLIRKVDLRRETLKQEIDQISESLINRLNMEKEECMNKIIDKNNNKISIEKDSLLVESCKKAISEYDLSKFKQTKEDIQESIEKIKKMENELRFGLWIHKQTKFKESNIKIDQNMFGKLVAWDWSEVREKRTLKGHMSSELTLVVLNNGEIASGSDDNTLKIWNAGNEKEIRTYRS